MRARLAPFAAALPLALALASCSGGAPQQAATPEATSTPAPTATPMPEATSTPAPAAAATPEAASTPAPTAAATPEAASAGIASADCPDGPTSPAAGGAPCVPARLVSACSNGIAIANPDAREGLVRDCALLLDGKDALRGSTPLNWSARIPMAEWEGVSIGAIGDRGAGRVTGIHLRNKELRGAIPPQLGYLDRLEYLHLGARNYLAGPIPPEFGNLKRLAAFFAGGRNRLTGPIPPELGSLPELHTLYLANNRLNGPIPRLGPNLRHLDLRGNLLTGPIPEWLSERPGLGLLILHDNRLSGPIPRVLGRLPRLREVTLASNALTGCVPSPLDDVRGDAASLGLPWCLRYDRLDTAGEVAEAGSWAILGGNGEALTTWEQLRAEAATLRVHQTDAGGNSWAPEFGAVAVNDLFEWRLADDCWVRYRVAGAPTAPASGASGRWEFPVEWHAYAATGAGCTGAVGMDTVLRADEAAPTVISTTEITSLVRQGPFQIAPDGWTGEIEQEVHYPEPPSGASGTSAAETSTITTSVAEARRLFRYWRDPALPASWAFGWAIQDPSGIRGPFPDGHCANYYTAEGYLAVRICIGYLTQRPFYGRLWWTGGILAFDLHMIDGHDVFVAYSPPGPAHERKICLHVWLFDKRSGLLYTVSGHNTSLCGDNVEAAIAIARSLPPPNDTP